MSDGETRTGGNREAAAHSCVSTSGLIVANFALLLWDKMSQNPHAPLLLISPTKARGPQERSKKQKRRAHFLDPS